MRSSHVPVLALLLALAGCSRARSDEAAATHCPEGVAEPQPATPEAVNERSVKRYDDEAALGYVDTTLVQSVMAHSTATGGDQITLVVGGTGVALVAERGNALLVSFPDPQDPSARRLGWIPGDAVRPRPSRACISPEVDFQTALGRFCATPCRDSSTCGPDAICAPGAVPVERNGRITNLLTYCVAR